jgi:hypothetical protein
MTRSWRNIDHDPQIDVMKTLWQKERLKEVDFAMLAGLSYQTIHKMFDNQTKRPQGLTYQKMLKAMGYRYDVVRDETPDYASEIPQARSEYKVHLTALKKKREQHSKKNGKKNGAK